MSPDAQCCTTNLSSSSRLPVRRTPAAAMKHDEQHCNRVNKMLRGEFAAQEMHDGRYDERTDKKASTDAHRSRPDEEERSYHFYRREREQMKILMCR